MEMQPLFDLEPYFHEDIEPETSLLSEMLGVEAAQEVIDVLGGQDLGVPIRERGNSYKRLVKQLGPETAQKLVNAFRGESIYIPLDDENKRQERNREVRKSIRNLMQQGITSVQAMKKVATQFKLSQRTIRRIFYN